MPLKGRKSYDWLLQSTTNAGAGSETKGTTGKFNIKCWADAGDGDFAGATVNIQIEAEDGVWITSHTFATDGVQFGEVGVGEERFRAFVVSPGANAISCTITYG